MLITGICDIVEYVYGIMKKVIEVLKDCVIAASYRETELNVLLALILTSKNSLFFF